jgi:hypothetical protein
VYCKPTKYKYTKEQRTRKRRTNKRPYSKYSTYKYTYTYFLINVLIKKKVLKIIKNFFLILFITTGFLMTSCASKLERVKRIAVPAGFKSKVIRTNTFSLQSFYRILEPGAPITIYIEGDGQAWLTRTQPSPNPTPTNPLVIRLATIDENENVIYLARPCQYVNLRTEKLCSIPYWTQKRFSREIIIAINDAINIMATIAKTARIHLVGYSGGGAVAAMVAAKRNDIASIRTLAGYMDHVALNRKVNVSPLIGSLDPIKAAPRLQKTPQIHYSGSKDKRVPGWVLKNFRKAVGSKECVTLRYVNATHEEGWEEVWQRVWSKIPTCNY